MITHQSCKCTSCGSNLQFDISSGHLKCHNCGREYSVEEYEQNISSDATQSQPENDWITRSFVCPSCQGEVSPAALSASWSCPFCGKPLEITDEISDSVQPDLIVPFMKEKKDVETQYRKLLARRSFLSPDFLSQIDSKSIKPYYFPFWIYDVKMFGSVTVKAEKILQINRPTCYHRRFKCTGSGRAFFNCVPQDGSSLLDDKISQSIEPFDFTKAKPYSVAYFSGFDVQLGDRGAQVSFDDMTERLYHSMDRFLIPTLTKYDYISVEERNYKLKAKKIRLAMLPVYLVDVQWHSKTYSFAMNGQTGRMVGEFPLNKLNIFLVAFSFAVLSVVVSYQSQVILPRYDIVTDGKFLTIIFLVITWLFWLLIRKTRLPLLFDQTLVAFALLFISILIGIYFLVISGDWNYYLWLLILIPSLFYYGLLENVEERMAVDSAALATAANEYIDAKKSKLKNTTVTHVKSYIGSSVPDY